MSTRGPRSLNIWVKYSLNVVAYHGRRENASILNESLGNCVMMLRVLCVRLHMDFVSMMRSLSNL